MSQKNELPALIGTLMITAALIGGGIWWFTQRSGIDPTKMTLPQNSAPPSSAGTPGDQTPVSQAGQLVDNFSQVKNVPNRLFSYGGSTSWAPLRGVNSVDAALQKAHPEFRLRYVNPVGAAPSTAQGIQMLIAGQVDFAQASRPLTQQELQQAQQRGFGLSQVPVAIDGVAVAVNPNLTLPGLTLDQLKAIYTGQVTNWQAVGGPNLPIVAFSRSLAGGTFFAESVMANQPLGSTVQIVQTTTEALQKIAITPGSIYFASAPEVVPQCGVKALPIGREPGQFVPPYQEPLIPANQCPGQRNQLNVAAFQSGQYPLTRSLFVIIKQNGQVEQQAGEAYGNLLLSQEGQNLIAQMGFVKIR
jgi:phosphate transport system substrate-binding protein